MIMIVIMKMTVAMIVITIVTMMIIPISHSNNSLSKICSKGWVAQKPFLIGSLTAALRLSKGWVQKDTNLGLRTGCSGRGGAVQLAPRRRALREEGNYSNNTNNDNTIIIYNFNNNNDDNNDDNYITIII